MHDTASLSQTLKTSIAGSRKVEMTDLVTTNLVSVVIICRNAGRSISKAIRSAKRLTGDVIVIDTGSIDDTLKIIKQHQVRLYQKEWLGYGATKNMGNELARHPWILSMDADEELDENLIEAIRQVPLDDDKKVFIMQRLSYLGCKPIYHGEWGRSFIPRLFNRNNAYWDNTEVHEGLIFINEPNGLRLPGILHHYTSPGIKPLQKKLGYYASLMADKYLARGKRVNLLQVLLSPAVNFLKNYIFKAGFLDGKEGWQIAKANAWYSFQKYRMLYHKHGRKVRPRKS